MIIKKKALLSLRAAVNIVAEKDSPDITHHPFTILSSVLKINNQ